MSHSRRDRSRSRTRSAKWSNVPLPHPDPVVAQQQMLWAASACHPPRIAVAATPNPWGIQWGTPMAPVTPMLTPIWTPAPSFVPVATTPFTPAGCFVPMQKTPVNPFMPTPKMNAPFIPPVYPDEPEEVPVRKTPRQYPPRVLPHAESVLLPSTPLFPEWGFYRDILSIEVHPLLQPPDMAPLPPTNNPLILRQLGKLIRATEFLWDIIDPPSLGKLITVRNVTVPAVKYYGERAIWTGDNKERTAWVYVTPDLMALRKGLAKGLGDVASSGGGIRVDAAGEFITVGEVLNAVYDFWQKPISRDEYRELVRGGKLGLTEERIRDMTYERIRKSGKCTEEAERLKGYRRVDLLAGRWTFGGLIPRYWSNDGRKTWYLEMSLLPIH